MKTNLTDDEMRDRVIELLGFSDPIIKSAFSVLSRERLEGMLASLERCQPTTAAHQSPVAQVVPTVDHGRCEGCGAVLKPEEIEPYGSQWCHVVPVCCGHFDEGGGCCGSPDPSPCGPVHRFTDVDLLTSHRAPSDNRPVVCPECGHKVSQSIEHLCNNPWHFSTQAKVDGEKAPSDDGVREAVEPSAGLLAQWAHNGVYTEMDKEAEAFAANFKSIPDAASRGFYVGWKLAVTTLTKEKLKAAPPVATLALLSQNDPDDWPEPGVEGES